MNNVIKKTIASFLVVVMMITIIPLSDFVGFDISDSLDVAIEAEAKSYITSSYSASGSNYTSSADLALMLNNVFSGDIDIYSNSGCTSEVSMPLGIYMSNSTKYYVKSKTTGSSIYGWQCYIYANAVYNKLFNEWPGHGNSFSHSRVAISGGSNTASYSMFSNAGIKCGAYMRTTTKSSGAYNGSGGHSLIILSYDSNYITYLEGNGDGNGLIRIAKLTWNEFNSGQLSGRSRYISHVVQPTDAYYSSLYGQITPPTTPDDSTNPDDYTFPTRDLYFTSPVMTGNDVKWVQNVLLKLGYSITIDGLYGPATRDVIKSFQSAYGLAVDGSCGPATRSKLLEEWNRISGIPVINKPSWVSISADKSELFTGESITITFDSDTADAYTIGIDRNEERILTQGLGGEKSFTYTCDQPGNYSAYVTASNSAGGFDSNRVYWTVIHVHSYMETENKPATCTESGFTVYACNCGESYNDTYPATGHTPGEWEVVTPADVDVEGFKQLKCTVCNYVLEEENIPALEHEHNFVAYEPIAPTCTEDGVIDYICECGSGYTEVIFATGHIPGEWEVVTSAGIGVEGKEQQKCTVCNTVVNERDIPALPEESTKPVEKPTDKPVEKPDAVKNFGDVDGNGKITAADARLALRISAKLEKATELQITVADMDKNGKITAADARKILRVSAKLETI